MKERTFITTNLKPSSKSPLVRGKGIRVTDAAGKTYVDLTSQTLNLALGHRNDTVLAAVLAQLRRLWFASSRFGSVPFLQLSKKLVEIAPPGFAAVNLKQTNGSDAVETAVKLARLHTRERTIVCVKDAWHGESGVTLGFSSNEVRKGSVVSETNVVFSHDATLQSLYETLKATPHAAAVLLDPAGVSSGLFRASDRDVYLPRIKELCVRRRVLLIFDEVQTFGGFLGDRLFAAEAFGVVPDIICLGKALGAGLPLSATLCSEELSGIMDYNNAEYTYGGQALACAAALGALAEWERRSEEFTRHYAAWADALKKSFEGKEHIELRQTGWIATLARKEDRFRDVWTAEVEREAFRAGYIVRKNDHGRRILLKPPVILAPREAQRACAKIADIIESVERRLEKEPSALIRKKKLVGKNRNEGYADALVRMLGEGFRARTSSAQEQHMLTERLADLGIPVARVYADSRDEVAYVMQHGIPADEWLAKLGPNDTAAANAFFVRQQNSLELAHDNGIVIGDRWPGNTIVAGERCVFVDYDVIYEGEFSILSAFEELFALFQSLAYLEDRTLADKLAGRFVRGILRRHGTRAGAAWSAISSFYTDAKKPENSTSLSNERYLDTVRLMGRHMSLSPRALPVVSPLEHIDIVEKRAKERSYNARKSRRL